MNPNCKDRRELYIKQVAGSNQERDYNIIELAALQPHLSYEEIIDFLKLEIGIARLSQIMADNKLLKLKLFAELNPLYLKEGRAFELAQAYMQKKIKNKETSKKDMADILQQLSKEIDGDKGVVIDQSQHITYSWDIPTPPKQLKVDDAAKEQLQGNESESVPAQE